VSSARAAVITVAALAGIGTLGFAASIGRDGESALTNRRPPHRTPHVLTVRPVRMVLLIALLLGAVIGAIEVAVPIFATGHNAPAASGLLIAAVSLGGIAGAMIYGSGQWRAPARRRLVLLLALMTVWLAILVPADTLLLAGLLLLLVGIPLNPALATFSLLIDRHVAEGTAAEAFGWLSTAIAGGTGAANAIAAAVAQRHDSEAAFVVAAVAAISATLLAGLGSRTVLRTPDRAMPR
jgi:predicted MFS family arabinose efflux permease